MLLRLSRISFCLAAVAAAAALLVPVDHETMLLAASGFACLFASGLWRSATKEAWRELEMVREAPAVVVLEAPSLLDAAALLQREVQAAPDREAALHAAARVLRGELGVRSAEVYEVVEVSAERALLRDLVEVQPGFRTTPHSFRLDGSPAALALRHGREAGSSPGDAAIPVCEDGRIAALIVLKDIGLHIESGALSGLLELARLTLSQPAPVAGPGRRPDREHPRGSPGVVPSPRPVRSRRVGRAHVLVAEDNPVQAEATACMLRRSGYRVTTASGMLDGWNAPGETQFDLILIDLHLLSMGAAGGLGRWRRGEDNAVEGSTAGDTPVIAVSASSLPEARIRELGFDDHLCKPFSQGQLLDMLNRHLRPPESAQSPEASWQADANAKTLPLPSLLDAGALARLAELDPTGRNQLLERIMRAFQTSVARLRPQLDAGRAADDLGAIKLVAHTLKSSSASIGALQLSQLCAAIETSIRVEPETELAPQLEALDAALDAVLVSIEALLKERM